MRAFDVLYTSVREIEFNTNWDTGTIRYKIYRTLSLLSAFVNQYICQLN